MLETLKLVSRQGYAFVARNFHLVKRYWGWELVWLIYCIVNALSITFIGVGMGTLTGSQDVDTGYLVVYLMIGTLVWQFLSSLFENISQMIQWERWEGTIEYTLMAPVRRYVHMAGQTVFAIIYGLILTGLIAIVMALFFELDLSRANIFGSVIILAMGGVSFVGIGIVASVLPLLYPERGTQMAYIIQALLLLISGVYYPVEVLPGWLQTVAKISPATYVLEGMRRALLEGTPTYELGGYIWPLLGMGIVVLPIGMSLFRAGERYARRTGRLKRSG